MIRLLAARIKAYLNASSNRHLKKSLLNALPFWIGALLTGLVAVAYARLFGWAESAAVYLFHKLHWYFLLVTPSCFLLAWYLVKRFAPFARGSGIPQVSAAITLSNPKDYYKVDRLLSIKLAFTKIVSSLALAAGGGVVGREGPTIQISASIFKAINEKLPDWYPRISRQNMIITGAAAGLASAFNTPLGGIVFAIEELTTTHFSYFKSALLTGVIIAGLTALTLLGPYLYLGYPNLHGLHSGIVIGVVFVALLSGGAAALMGKMILSLTAAKKKWQKTVPEWIIVAFFGFLVALAAVCLSPEVLGSGKELMAHGLFSADKDIHWSTPLLRFFGPIISFSAGAAGGVFAPALSAGSSIGNLTAQLLHIGGAEANLLILSGMTAFLTGVTRSPFTSAILVLEMTNSHNVIFYIMISALVASLIAKILARHPFYEHLKDQYLREVEHQ